ncbi:MCE family protein [[Mycobacterium] wendilense]|uniref:MCE family protein n=1 Tax=[Mycobacterium] wendilense TaxID=3064284 RepID=A0ABN9P4M6_9MYCO|nr:MCE family protein [Mycolicibacterium sp. MU0050]CAJ1586830.1 MCE family protein [Mycolicibacterium sp. MU0050]
MKRTLIGAACLLAVLAAGTAFTVLPHDRPGPMVVTAHFQDAVGLYPGNSVAVLGMPVGSVRRVEPKTTYVEVELEIDPEVELPADVNAVTVSTSILTDRHVELTPPYSGGPKLRSGDVLGPNRTRTPVEFDRTLAMIQKLASALKGDSSGGGPVADLISIGAEMTDGNGVDLRATLDELSQALRLGADNGAQSRQNIRAVAENLADLSQAAVENDTVIREFGAHVHQLSEILAQEELGSGSTGAKINEILDQATVLLEGNRNTLSGFVTDSEAISRAMVDYRRELAEFFNVAPLALDNVYSATDPNAGVIRVHALADKIMFNSQLGKEICNLIGKKQLGCATGTLRDYGPDFGITGMLELMAGVGP